MKRINAFLIIILLLFVTACTKTSPPLDTEVEASQPEEVEVSPSAATPLTTDILNGISYGYPPEATVSTGIDLVSATLEENGVKTVFTLWKAGSKATGKSEEEHRDDFYASITGTFDGSKILSDTTIMLGRVTANCIELSAKDDALTYGKFVFFMHNDDSYYAHVRIIGSEQMTPHRRCNF